MDVRVQNRLHIQYVGEHPMKEPLQALQQPFEITRSEFAAQIFTLADCVGSFGVGLPLMALRITP
jgi:hypothetical protein